MKNFFVILFTLISLFSYSQKNYIDVTTHAIPPFSNRIDKLIDSENFTTFLKNNTNNHLTAKFYIAIKKDGSEIFRTNESFALKNPITLMPSEGKMFDWGQFGQISYNDLIMLPEAEKMGLNEIDFLRTGRLPEGMYEFCISLFDYTNQDQEQWNIPETSCAKMNLTDFEPPQIISINGANCGEAIKASQPQFVGFTWLSPAGFTGLLDYEVEIVEVFPNVKEDYDAMFSATSPPFIKEITNMTSFIIALEHPTLKKGARYVLRVRAIDPSKNSSFRNNGYSEICSFVFGEESDEILPSNISSNILYPELNDTIPFPNPLYFIKWDPYLQNVENIKAKYIIKENNQDIDEFDVEIDAKDGIVKELENKNNNKEISEDIANQIILGNYSERRKLDLLEKGKEYTVDVKIDFKLKGDPVVQSINESSTFVYGMPSAKVEIQSEKPNIKEKTTFKINYLNKPNPLISSFKELDKLIETYEFDSTLYVNERALLEISPQEDFDSIWYKKTASIEKEITITNSSPYTSITEIYEDIDFDIKIKETGTWYARVKWLNVLPNDTSSIDSSEVKEDNLQTKAVKSYYTSKATKFTVDDGVDREDSDCQPEGCNYPPIAINEVVPADSVVVGTELDIGYHKLKITKLDSESSPYSGEGIIKINPFPQINFANIPVKVKFSKLKVNQDLRVYAGKAETIDGSGLFTDKTSEKVGQMLADSIDNQNTIKDFVQNAGSYVESQFEDDVGMPMPIGFVDNKYGDVEYKLAIASIVFDAESANMNVVMGVNTPQLANYLDFYAKDVCLKPGGISVAKIDLILMGDREMNIGSSMKLVLSGAKSLEDEKSKVEWDCKGLKNINLAGYVELDSNIIYAEGDNIKNVEDKIIKANFNVNIQKWTDFIVDLGVNKAFEVKGLPNWSFNADNISLDLSSNKNVSGMSFPDDYEGDKSNEWQGIFFKNIQVKTPRGFEDIENQEERLTFELKSMLIDRTGVSFHMNNENLLSLEKGRFGDWALSISSIDIKVLSNAFQQGKIKGQLKVPLDTAAAFEYDMMVDYSSDSLDRKLSYSTTVKGIDELDVPMWKAKFTLLPNSHAKFYYDSKDSIFTELKLNGQFGIKGKLPLVGDLNFSAIKFQDFKIGAAGKVGSMDSLIFNMGSVSFASPAKSIGGFPVNFNEVKTITKREIINEERTSLLGLQIDVDVSLNMGANSFGGGTKMKLWARQTKDQGILGFKYHDFNIDSIGISGKISVLEVSGGLNFYDEDSVYGKGMKGHLNASFTPGIQLGAMGYFGTMTQGNSEYKYWGVFGNVSLTSGIPILAAFEINGFGGGAYNNMELILPESPPVSRVVNQASTDLIPTLRPKNNVFGFRATVFAQSFPGGESWKASLSLGAEIKKSDFSVNNINLQGNMWVMADNNPAEGNPQAAFWAGAFINYDFIQEQFDGNFSFYLNKELTGNSSIVGIHGNDRAGNILMHYSKENWFVYAGQPKDRIGAKLSSPEISLNGYFVTGTNVPGIPDLPKKISNVFPQAKIPNRSSEINSGKGFGFGAEFEIQTGDKKFLFLKANLDLIAGFDMSLLKYTDASCDGLNTVKIGIDGWYALGQVYSFSEGAIHADFMFFNKELSLEVLQVQGGLKLSAGIPSPTWLSGNIKGNYSVLGGKVKGDFDFELQIGEECRPSYIQESPVVDLKIVADNFPKENTTGHDIFTMPEILLNFKRNEVFEIEIVDNKGKEVTKEFRAVVNYKLKEGNKELSTTTEASMENGAERLKIILSSGEPLRPYQSYNLELEEYFQEKKSNNKWATIKDKDGKKLITNRTIKFMTGGIPPTIPEQLVVSMTPEIRENFFMKGESEKVDNSINRPSQRTSGSNLNDRIINKLNTSSSADKKLTYSKIPAKVFKASFSYNLKSTYFIDSMVVGERTLRERLMGAEPYIKSKAEYWMTITNLQTNEVEIEEKIRVSSNGRSVDGIKAFNSLKNNMLYKLNIIRKSEEESQKKGSNENAYLNMVTTQLVNLQLNPNNKMQVSSYKFQDNYNQKVNKEAIIFTSYFNTSKYNTMEEKVVDTKITYNLLSPITLIGAYFMSNSKNEGFDEREINNKVWLKDIIKPDLGWYKTWDSMRVVQNYINVFADVTRSKSISNNIPSLDKNNTDFNLVGSSGPMWRVSPYDLSQVVKTFGTNDEFLSGSRAKFVFAFTTDFDSNVKKDRKTISNNIVKVLSRVNQMEAKLRQIGANTKILPSNIRTYFNKYMNGVYIVRSESEQSIHDLRWYSREDNLSIPKLTKEIKNYKFNTNINQ